MEGEDGSDESNPSSGITEVSAESVACVQQPQRHEPQPHLSREDILKLLTPSQREIYERFRCLVFAVTLQRLRGNGKCSEVKRIYRRFRDGEELTEAIIGQLQGTFPETFFIAPVTGSFNLIPESSGRNIEALLKRGLNILRSKKN